MKKYLMFIPRIKIKKVGFEWHCAIYRPNKGMSSFIASRQGRSLFWTLGVFKPKNIYKAIFWMFIPLIVMGCKNETAIEQLNKIKRPAIVFSTHQSIDWYDYDQLTLIDADGSLIEIMGNGKDQLVDKYNIGDTLK